MIKTILKNQKGVSLVEVTVASALSVMVAVGVMRISENSNKSLRSIQNKSDITQFKNLLKSRLSNSDNCDVAKINGVNAFMGKDISSDVVHNTNGHAFNSRNSGANEFVIGEVVPSMPHWTVDSITMQAFNNGATGSVVGECNVIIALSKSNTKGSYGGKNINIEIPMSCQVDTVGTKVVTACSSMIEGGEEGHFIATDDGSGGNFLSFDGLSGGPRVRIGDNQIGDSSVTAGITLDPLGTQTTPGGNLHGMQVPNTVAITFGNTNQVEMSYDPSDDDSVSGAGSTVNIDSSMRFTGSLILDADSHPGGTNIVIPNRVYAREFMAVSGNSLVIGDNNDLVTVGDNLTVTGDTTATNYFYNSDERLKKDIETIKNASETISDLRGVNYVMRHEEFPDYNFPRDLQFGLIAQEVEKVIPELVGTNPSTGFKSVEYGNIIPVLIEAFKEEKNKKIELEKKVDLEKQKVKELYELVKDLQKRLQKIEKSSNEKSNFPEEEK